MNGTNRISRLADFFGLGGGNGASISARTTIIQGDSVNLPELIRNIGYRLLDEPTSVQIQYDDEENEVKIKYTDPNDITSYAPVPVDWAGTVIVRNENGAPLHPWDGTIINTSTTRDEYKNDWFIDDNNIQRGGLYFYGIFPYHIALDDNDHPIKYYRWTKVVSVNTGLDLQPAIITDLEVDGVNVTVSFEIPALKNGLYASITLVAKKDGTPLSVDDGDEFITLTDSDTSAEVSGLDELSHYYFVIFSEDDQGNTATSEPMDCETEESKGITLFTDHFNQSVLVDGWDISVYRSIYSVAQNNWNPIGASEDYLTSMNFMCGNASRRPIIVENEVLRPNGAQYGMTDTVFWIPVKRTYFGSKIHISFEGKMSGYGQFYYAVVWVACVENGTWYNLGGKELSSQSDLDWHSVTGEVDNTHQYVDYIGLGFCDGISYFRNIIIS